MTLSALGVDSLFLAWQVYGVSQNYFKPSLGLIIEWISVSPVVSHSPVLSAAVTGSQRVYYSLSFTASFVSIIHFGVMIMYITGNITLLFVDDIIQSGLKCDVCVTKLVLWPTLHPQIISSGPDRWLIANHEVLYWFVMLFSKKAMSLTCESRLYPESVSQHCTYAEAVLDAE